MMGGDEDIFILFFLNFKLNMKYFKLKNIYIYIFNDLYILIKKIHATYVHTYSAYMTHTHTQLTLQTHIPSLHDTLSIHNNIHLD